jgi:1-deoxy-D-xylulose-5-phosphate reductoisomerase
LARHALRQGGVAPTLLNAANEAAVAAFLDGSIGFLEIARVVERVLERAEAQACGDLETVLVYDALGRRLAAQLLPTAGDRAIA